MRRALWLALVGCAAVLLAVPSCSGGNGDLGVGAPCFNPTANDGGGENLGTCDPASSFCFPGAPGQNFTCMARPSTAFIFPDIFAIQFYSEFNSGVYVGTSVQNSMQVFNEGDQSMTVNSVNIAGPSAAKFTYEVSPSLPASVASRQEAYVTVTYTPWDAGTDTATLTIASNAPNTPPGSMIPGTLEIAIQAVAISPPDGG
jgi:hypothetical protein